jgi:Putative prokaryotic signal transducing protein
MIKIFTSQDITLLNFYKSILEDNGIQAIIKNYYLMSGSGDIPPNECVPELWILDDSRIEDAGRLLMVEKGSPWQCECGEKIAGQFVQCWKCGRFKNPDL